jgi:hypothetical protein
MHIDISNIQKNIVLPGGSTTRCRTVSSSTHIDEICISCSQKPTTARSRSEIIPCDRRLCDGYRNNPNGWCHWNGPFLCRYRFEYAHQQGSSAFCSSNIRYLVVDQTFICHLTIVNWLSQNGRVWMVCGCPCSTGTMHAEVGRTHN